MPFARRVLTVRKARALRFPPTSYSHSASRFEKATAIEFVGVTPVFTSEQRAFGGQAAALHAASPGPGKLSLCRVMKYAVDSTKWESTPVSVLRGRLGDLVDYQEFNRTLVFFQL